MMHFFNNSKCQQYVRQIVRDANNSKPSDGGGTPHSDEEREHNEGEDDVFETNGQTEGGPMEVEDEQMEEQEQPPTSALMHNPLCIAEFLLLNLLTKLGAPMYAYDQFRQWARYIGRNKIDPYLIRTRSAALNELASTFKLREMKPIMRRAEILCLREVHEQGRKARNERERKKEQVEKEKEMEMRGVKRPAEGMEMGTADGTDDDLSDVDEEASLDDDDGDANIDASKMPIAKTDTYYEEDIHHDFHHVPIDIVTFSVREGLKNLLCERPEIMRPEKLVVNEDPAKRFLEYEPSDEFFSEINTGDWYKEAYKKLIVHPTEEFLCPLVIFVDHTAIDFIGRWGLTPVVATCSIFKEKWRRDPNCWIILGFIPDVKRNKSRATQDRERTRMKNITCVNMHTCLEVIFKDLIEVQKEGGLWLLISLDGGLTQERRLCRFPIAVVLGDIQGNNQLCGRYVYFGLKQMRMCRACDVPPDECSNYRFQCTFTTAKEVKAANDCGTKESLKELALYRVKNVFLKLCLGGFKYGIHGQTPVDIMHTLLEGIVKYILKGFFDTFGDAARAQFDAMSIKLNKQSRSYARGQYGRVHCGKGVSNVTLVTAKELAGILLLVALTLLTPEGSHAVSVSYKRNGMSQEELQKKIRDWIYVFEMLACFERWCCKVAYWHRQDETGYGRAMLAIRLLMRSIFNLAPRNIGQGWQIEKFHDLLHIPLCIKHFGSPRGYDTGSAEKNHKCFAKKPAKLTQKRVSTFEKQTGERCFEMLVVSRALQGFASIRGCIPSEFYDNEDKALVNYLALLDDEGENMEDCHHQGATRFMIFIDRPRKCYSLCTLRSTGRERIPDRLWQQAWTDVLTQHYYPINQPESNADRQHNDRVAGREDVCFMSEFNKQGIRYRAHPDYQSQGAWYDWVELSWAKDDGDNGKLDDDGIIFDDEGVKVGRYMAPGQVLMFIVWKHPQTKENHYEALVWAATGASEDHSVLTRKFKMEQNKDCTPLLRIVDAGCLGKHIFCFREDKGTKSTGFALQVLPQTEWADEFHVD
jgi:hypothetical protein